LTDCTACSAVDKCGTCKDTMYPALTTGVCTLCTAKADGKTLTCDSTTGKALTCATGYFADATTGNCLACSANSDCSECSSATVCTKCDEGFMIVAVVGPPATATCSACT